MGKSKFQPIVMPCTQKQYASLIPILKKNNIRVDEIIKTVGSLTITNNHNGVSRFVSWNVHDLDSTIHIVAKRKVYKRFNRKLFLKSLGIVEIVEEPEFVLPEKWAIKRTPETDALITNYFRKLHNRNYLYNNPSRYLYHDQKRKDGYSHTCVMNSYKEITFEQFQKYVLEQNVSLLESKKETTMKSEFKSKQTVEAFKKGDLVETSCYVGIVTEVHTSNVTICVLHQKSHINMLSVGTVFTYDSTELKKIKGVLTLTQE